MELNFRRLTLPAELYKTKEANRQKLPDFDPGV